MGAVDSAQNKLSTAFGFHLTPLGIGAVIDAGRVCMIGYYRI